MIGRARPRSLMVALAACASALALLVGAVPASGAPAPSPWLQTGYNAAGSNANLLDKTFTPANLSQVTLKHTYSGDPNYDGCGGGVTAAAFSDSRTYAVVDDVVTAYLSYSGKVLWRATNPPETSFQTYDSTIAVSNGQVVISGNECGSRDPYAFIQAFDSETGEPTWNRFFGDGVNAVEVSGQQVVAHVRAGIESDPSTSVYSLLDGSPEWSTTRYCDSEQHVVGKLVFVDTCRGSDVVSLRALKVTTGKTVWSRAGSYRVLGGDTDAAAAQHLYVVDGNGVIRDLNPATGAPRFALADASGSILAVDDQRVYVACSGSPVCAYDIATGRKVWSSSVGGGNTVEANGLLFTGGQVLNARTGRSLATLPAAPLLLGSGNLGLVDSLGTLSVYGV